jgi:hypothetical protein
MRDNYAQVRLNARVPPMNYNFKDLIQTILDEEVGKTRNPSVIPPSIPADSANSAVISGTTVNVYINNYFTPAVKYLNKK